MLGVHRVDTDATAGSSSLSPTATSSSSSQKHTSTGAIAGSTIGGIIGAAALVLAALFMLRRRRRTLPASGMARFTQNDSSRRVDPFITTTFTADNNGMNSHIKGTSPSLSSSSPINLQQSSPLALTAQRSMRSLTGTDSATEPVSQIAPLHLRGPEFDGSLSSPASSASRGVSRSGVGEGEGRHLQDQIMMLRDEIGQLQVLQGVGPPSYTTEGTDRGVA